MKPKSMRALISATAATLIMSGCATSGAADMGLRTPSLAAPSPMPFAPVSPDRDTVPRLSEDFDVDMGCQAASEFAGTELRFSTAAQERTGSQPLCFVEASSGSAELPDRNSTEPWRVHVLYLPKGIDPNQVDYLSAIEHGAIDVITEYNQPESPVPSKDDPGHSGGGIRAFEVRARPAFVQRIASERNLGIWWERTPAGTMAKHVIHMNHDPDSVIEVARSLR